MYGKVSEGNTRTSFPNVLEPETSKIFKLLFKQDTDRKIKKLINNQLTLLPDRSLSNDPNKDPTYKWERIRWEDKKQFPESSRRAWR